MLLDESIDKAVKHYSSLFTLPSLGMILFLLAVLCLSSGILSIILLHFSLENLVLGVTFGVGIFICTLISDLAMNKFVLGFDPIYEVRRCLGLSLFSFLLWMPFVILGNVLSFFFQDVNVWLKLWFFGFSAVTILRLTVLNATSIASTPRRVVVAFLSPFTVLLLLLHVWTYMGNMLTMGIWIYLATSFLISLISVYAFTTPLNNIAKKKLGIPSFVLFKAFMINWIEGINAPLENLFEKLGIEKDVNVSIMKLESSSGTKALLVVPRIHPGPFKNVGSSLFPSMLQQELEKAFGCVASVPHGLLGHEFDVASRKHVERIIEKIVDSSKKLSATNSLCTPLIHTTNGTANVFCQIFDDCAVLTLSLAPKTTEDLPAELGDFALEEARKHGLTRVIVINAHNSLDGKVSLEEAIKTLKNAMTQSLDKVSVLKKLPFRVGAAKLTPTEFRLEDGMGPGGITAITLEVGNQKFAYITIDGNNMLPELRRKILSMLQEMGISRGEVFTTDTHAVTALVLTRRGYHVLGEVIPQEKLVGYVKKTVEMALSNMEPAKAGCTIETIKGVKVIGERRITELCSLIEPIIKRAKRNVVPVFLTTSLLLLSLLVLTF